MASIFVTHGGGPLPLLQKQHHVEFTKALVQISQKYPQPKAIILFSAHWQEESWAMIDHDNPPLYYDYYNFPKQTYNLNYPIGSTNELRKQVKNALFAQGVEVKSNYQRGYDHGVFIPLMLAYPHANVPVIQISILKSLDPQAHYRMGVALRGLKKQGFLIVGSGASVHGISDLQKSKQFDDQLSQKWINTEYNQQKLLANIKNWRNLKYAKQFHPREQHLVPFFVNLGAYQGINKKQQKYVIMGCHCTNFILS